MVELASVNSGSIFHLLYLSEIKKRQFSYLKLPSVHSGQTKDHNGVMKHDCWQDDRSGNEN